MDTRRLFLQAKGAKDVGVELFSLTKSYNMAGWRMALHLATQNYCKSCKIKSYMDYGIFTPIQVAAITALKSDQSCVKTLLRLIESEGCSCRRA